MIFLAFCCFAYFAYIVLADSINAKRMLRIEHRIAEILLRVGPTTRCPVCGHPAIPGAFHEDDPYTCLDCGTQHKWVLEEGVYRLEPTDEEGVYRLEPTDTEGGND